MDLNDFDYALTIVDQDGNSCFKMLLKCLTLLCLLTIKCAPVQSVRSNKSSLTFVIDDTLSMANDIDKVKLGIDAIFDTVLAHKKSPIENYIIVTFNDYKPDSAIRTNLLDTKLRIRTDNREKFKSALRSINVDGGDDCPEYSMSGIKRGLEASLPECFMYVYTDAPSKDYKMYESVKNLAMGKQCQVNFVVSNDEVFCPFKLMDGDLRTNVYFDLAKITHGKVFQLEKSQINQITEYVKDTIKERKYTLVDEELPPGKNNITIPVDPTTKDVTVAVTSRGTVSKVDVTSPCGSKPPTKTISKTDKITIINFQALCAGDYTIYIESADKTSILATGTSTVMLKHGFSTIKPASLDETSTRPVPDVKSYVSIAVMDGDIQLLAIKIRDIRDKKLMSFTANDDTTVVETPLVKVNEKFYITEPILPPDDTFHIAMICYDSNSKTNFTRLSPPIEYQKFIPEDIKAVPSSVSIQGDTNQHVKFGDNLKIICMVRGYPKPNIIWRNVKNGLVLPSEVSIYELPNNYTSILILDNIRENGTYECSAKNENGSDAKQVTVLTTEPKHYFNVTGLFLERTFIEYKNKGEIHCKVDSYPPAKVTWLKKGKPIKSGDNIKIHNSINKSTLTIEHAKLSDKGAYVCIAKNEDTQARIIRMVEITGIDPATIITKSKDFMNIKVGEELKLDCEVKGIPTPTVTWFKDDSPLSRQLGSAELIKENVQLSDSGLYICEAKNQLNVDYKKIFVEVFLPPYIIAPKSTNIEVSVWDNVTLPCEAKGYPEPKVEWIYRDHDGKEARISEAEPLLYLKHIQMKQAGQYICVATNSAGSANLTHDVQVFAPPIIDNRYLSKEFTAVEGDIALRITCNASGNPKPYITWSKDGLNLALGTYYNKYGDDFLIMNISENSKGFYKCEAKNRLGTDSEIFKVSVTKYVSSNPPTSYIRIKSGTPTEIPCNIKHELVDLLRWYRNGFLIETGRLILDNPKINDSGVYTCRVSNIFSSKSGDVQVEVGEEPAFMSDEDLIVEVNEEGSYYELYCGANGVPEPMITWYHDDVKLDTVGPLHAIKLNLANIGKYTCKVQNYFGQISRTFDVVSPDCFINTENLPKQPLLVSSRITWPEYRTFKKQIVIPKYHNFLLHCPSQFKKFHTTNLQAFCGSDKKIVVNGNDYDYSDLQCNEEVRHKVQNTGEKCLPGNTEKIKIEYEIDVASSKPTLGVYEICINKTINMPIYGVHDMGFLVASEDVETAWSDQDFFNVDFDDAYDCKMQTSMISASLGRNFHRAGDCCFFRRQLVNPRDVFMGVPQTSTYSYFNVVPHWSTCHMENWNDLEQKVRTVAKNSYYSAIKVWTGTAGQLTLPNGLDHSQRVYIKDRYGVSQQVPLYLWKVVQDPSTSSSLAIIQLNVPDLAPSDVSKYVRCKDICTKTDWMGGAQWKDVNRGYTYCCSLADFETAFGYRNVFKPMFNVLQTNKTRTPIGRLTH